MDVLWVAHAYQRQQIALARRISAEVLGHWRGMNTANLAESWATTAGPVFALVTGGQFLAASTADGYTADVLGPDAPPPAAPVSAYAFAGIASDGRPLASLLAEPVITAKTLIGRGATVARAMAGAGLQLDMIVRTQLADAGRVASGVAITSRERVSYVRMVSPGACSRCVVLAGKRYAWNARFLRHPRCHCTAIPVTEDIPGDVMTSPKAYFGNLSTAEQDRTFTKAGAQAIRDGADIGQVVNARRGMYAAGIGTKTFQATREGTTVRGLFGGFEIDPTTGALRRRPDGELVRRKSGSRTIGAAAVPRLMPEQIYIEANGSRDEAIRLLRRFGYLR